MGLRKIFERACLADEDAMEARAAAEERLARARAAGRLATERHFEDYRATVETASTTQILGGVAMVNPSRLVEAADQMHRQAESILAEGGIDPEQFSSERSIEE